MKNKIKVFRAMNDMTQADLANSLGVSRQTIHSIEKSKFVPSTVLALKIARLFKTSVEEVFDLEKND